MTEVTYTHFYDTNSSLVDGIYFNETDDTVVLDLDDELYRYTSVTRNDVDSLLRAHSTGGYYNTYFKHQFGPGEHLGTYGYAQFNHLDPEDWDEPEEEEENYDDGPEETFTPKGLSESPTKEFSLSTPASKPSPADEGVNDYTVHFNLSGVERTHVVPATNDVEAAKAVRAIAGVFGVEVKVTKVVVEFE